MAVVCIFFFKQKTAYEIKECDWSSDVCSSDLSHSGKSRTTHRPQNQWTRGDEDYKQAQAADQQMRLIAFEKTALPVPWNHGTLCRIRLKVCLYVLALRAVRAGWSIDSHRHLRVPPRRICTTSCLYNRVSTTHGWVVSAYTTARYAKPPLRVGAIERSTLSAARARSARGRS